MCFLSTCGFLCVCECVSVWVCAAGDLWPLSSSASSLSLVAWRMNGPLSALPQPLPLVSLSLKLPPFFSSVLPSLYYLISPHALPLRAPCHPHFLLPILSPPLTLLIWSPPPAAGVSVTPPISICHRGSEESCDQIMTSNLKLRFQGALRSNAAQIVRYLLLVNRLTSHWLDVEFALGWGRKVTPDSECQSMV